MSPHTTSIRNRLKIDDLLDIAGPEALKGFGWSDGICSSINPYLSLDKRITILNTGDEVRAVVKRLPSHVQIRLSFLLIDVETGDVTSARQTSDGFPAVTDDDLDTPPDDTPPPHRQQPGYERYENERNPIREERVAWPEDRKRTPPNSTIMMLIAGVLVFIALFMTFTISKIARETGTAAESSTLEVVIKVLGDVFKSSAETNPDTRGQSDDSSSSSDSYSDEEPANPRYQDDTSSDDGPSYGK